MGDFASQPRFGEAVHLRHAENAEALGLTAQRADAEIRRAQLYVKAY